MWLAAKGALASQQLKNIVAASFRKMVSYFAASEVDSVTQHSAYELKKL